jgi:peptidoglycan/LPS O-acetylase OafA/YrhL
MTQQKTQPNQTGEKTKFSPKQVSFTKSLSLALEFAFMILLPLLVFGGIGKWLEQHYQNKLWIIAGLLFALTTSIIWFYRKINDLYKDFID